MFVKPATPGLKVPHPTVRGRYLADEGEEVTDSFYWQRRIGSGEVVAVESPAAATPEPPPQEPPAASDPTDPRPP